MGLERAGFEVRWMVEIDDFCQKVLQKHWPNMKRYSDVREVGKNNLEPVDLICGGFPCQPARDEREKVRQQARDIMIVKLSAIDGYLKE